MSVKIKKINIKAFRGIPDLEMEIDGKSLLLRGENGTGKSSIVDAIEFFFTGKISHLEGVRSLSLNRHGPHVNFTPDDVSVEITFNPGNISLVRTFSSEPSPPAQFSDYFQVTQKRTFILRRSQILEFIVNQPAERFRAIGSIIGIEPLDNVELEMMRLRDELKGKIDSREKYIKELFRYLSDDITKDITDVDGILPALNEILQESRLPPIESLEKIDEYLEKIFKTTKIAQNTDNIVEVINEILEITSTPFISQEIIDDIQNVNERIKPLLSDKTRIELHVAGLLESGRKIIEQDKMDICPLCEQRIDRERLLLRIKERLNTFKELSDKAAEVRSSSASIIESLEKALNKLQSITSKIESLPEFSKEKEVLYYKLKLLSDFIEKVKLAKDLKNEIPTQDISQLKDEINKLGRSISEKCSQILDKIGLTDDEKKILEVIRLIEQVMSKVQDLLKVSSELRIYQRYLEYSEKIYTTFSDTKKSKIQEIYNTIQGDIEKFYLMLHPNEPHRNIRLMVAFGRRASTELKIKSFGRSGEDPRALTSEGHLDSLGLCIFLSFIKKFNKGCPLVILDDVVTTIDASHRHKLAELLLKELGDYQLIVTTHDGIWYEQLVNMQRALNVQGNFKNMEIIAWSVDTGPIIKSFKLQWEKIQDKLRNHDKTGAGNQCRVYLEWLLKEICEQLEVHIPYKQSGKYTVIDLFDPAEKRIKEKLKENELKNELLGKFENLRATSFMGNLLSHDNPEIENLSIEEVKSFCRAVRDLHEALLCPKCGKFLKYFRDSKILRCPDLRCESPKKGETK